VVEATLVDATVVPVGRGPSTVVAPEVPVPAVVVTARRGSGAVARLPRIGTRSSKTHSEQAGDADSGGQGGSAQHSLESH
jgi:hypothetical protein